MLTTSDHLIQMCDTVGPLIQMCDTVGVHFTMYDPKGGCTGMAWCGRRHTYLVG